MTEFEIQNIIYYKYLQHNSFLVLPNSFVFGWEADIVVITRTLFIHEFEIKISRSDFLADLKKDKHEDIKRYIDKRSEDELGFHLELEYTRKIRKPANYFWYVCPEGVIKKEEIPAYAGLYYLKWNTLYVQVKAPRIHKEKIDPRDALQLCGSINGRYWDKRLGNMGENDKKIV